MLFFKTVKFTSFICITLISSIGITQNISLNLHKTFNLLRNDELPNNLLISKSAVIVRLGDQEGQTVPDDRWQEVSKEAHEGFKRTGIDAVAYYYLDDIFSGTESQRAISSFLTKRGIKNLIFINYDKTETGAISYYNIVITPYSESEDFLIDGQLAWKGESPELGRIMNRVFREAVPSQQRTNLLISEKPEFFEDAQIIRGKREEVYPVDVKSFKMAVPQWSDSETSLSTIMSQYPLAFEFTDQFPNEDSLRYRQGSHFVLYSIYTSGSTIKRMLDYKKSEEKRYLSVLNKDGKSEVISYSGMRKVYKFYIKHIITGNVFLGSVWDAHPTREDALNSFIWNLKNELKLD